MTKRLPTQLRFIFVVLSLLIIPTFTSALDLSASALPVWSDQIGGFSVTSDCSDDGRYVVAGSDTGTVRMYTYTGGILWTYRIPEKSVTAVAISGDGSVVAAADYDPLGPDAGGEILYFTRDGELVWRSHTGATVQRVALSDDGNTLLASGNSALYVYDKTGTRQSTFRLNETIWSVAVSGDGSRGVAGAGTVTANSLRRTRTARYPGVTRLQTGCRRSASPATGDRLPVLTGSIFTGLTGTRFLHGNSMPVPFSRLSQSLRTGSTVRQDRSITCGSSTGPARFSGPTRTRGPSAA